MMVLRSALPSARCQEDETPPDFPPKDPPPFSGIRLRQLSPPGPSFNFHPTNDVLNHLTLTLVWEYPWVQTFMPQQ